MFIYLNLVLFILFLFNVQCLFINEEFLISIILVIFFIFSYIFLKKNLLCFFKNRTEEIFFLFLYLINLNLLLIKKISHLFKLIPLKFDIIIVLYYFYLIYNLFNKFLLFELNLLKLVNTNFIKLVFINLAFINLSNINNLINLNLFIIFSFNKNLLKLFSKK